MSAVMKEIEVGPVAPDRPLEAILFRGSYHLKMIAVLPVQLSWETGREGTYWPKTITMPHAELVQRSNSGRLPGEERVVAKEFREVYEFVAAKCNVGAYYLRGAQ